MSEILGRFSLDAIKFDFWVGFGMVAAWLMLVVCAVHSIWMHSKHKNSAILWTLVVVFVPVIGVLVYLPFSFKLEHYPDLFIWKKNRQK
ncbi:MAG: PLDc N-terminal domain-containing protein [Verrucomicrobiota bacterium]